MALTRGPARVLGPEVLPMDDAIGLLAVADVISAPFTTAPRYLRDGYL